MMSSLADVVKNVISNPDEEIHDAEITIEESNDLEETMLVLRRRSLSIRPLKT